MVMEIRSVMVMEIRRAMVIRMGETEMEMATPSPATRFCKTARTKERPATCTGG
jgi:hypothetical protein